MKRQKLIAILLTFAMIFACVPMNSQAVVKRSPRKVVSLSLKTKQGLKKLKKGRYSLSMKQGAKYRIRAVVKVVPDTKKHKKLTYKSSKKSVVSVNSKGIISAKKPGNATITVRSLKPLRGKRKSCTIRVKVSGIQKEEGVTTSSPELTAEPARTEGSNSMTPTKTSETTPTVTPTKMPETTPTMTPAVTPTITPETTPTMTPAVTPTKTPETTPTMTPAVTPTKTPEATPAVTPTKTPKTTPTVTGKPTTSPEFHATEQLTLSADTQMASANAEVLAYNEDGSVTVKLKNQSGGGGIVFYANADKSKVDLSDYTKVIFNITSDTSTGAAFSVYKSNTPGYWNAETEVLGYSSFSSEKGGSTTAYTISGQSEVYGFCIKYNPYGITNPPDEITITIHSITLTRTDVTDVTTNYDPLYQLAAEHGVKFGTVVNPTLLQDKNFARLVKYHFNSITASNEMKAYSLLNQKQSMAAYQSEDSMPVMNYTNADLVMDFAKENGIRVRGHALVWDAGMSDWFFREGYTSDGEYVTQEVAKKRLKSYIAQVVTHFEEKYPGVIYCWDVVNEAIETGNKFEADDPRCVENNIFAQRIGRDYVELSYLYTKEVLDEIRQTIEPTVDIKLFYNDFSTFYSPKREAICELVTSINSYQQDSEGKNVKLCDGVGMQSYIGGYGKQKGCMNEGDIDLVKAAITKFHSLGVEVHVTELAVRNYENTEEIFDTHGAYYEKLFDMYCELNQGEDKPLTSISIWGLTDDPYLKTTDYSYKMNGPYCGILDEGYQAKPALDGLYAALGGK